MWSKWRDLRNGVSLPYAQISINFNINLIYFKNEKDFYIDACGSYGS